MEKNSIADYNVSTERRIINLVTIANVFIAFLTGLLIHQAIAFAFGAFFVVGLTTLLIVNQLKLGFFDESPPSGWFMIKHYVCVLTFLILGLLLSFLSVC
jgi:hypothetical protein